MSDYSEYEKKLISLVEEHGWQYTYVFDPEGTLPSFAYSVGFPKSIGAPEFIVFGLSRDIMNHMIWEIFRQIEAGATVTDGKRWSDLLEGFECVCKKARHPELFSEYAVSAKWFWEEMGNDGVPDVYQIVWPGARQGLFPWEKGCSQDVIDAQPQLWLQE